MKSQSAALLAGGVALAAALLAHASGRHSHDGRRQRHPHHRRPERKAVVGRRSQARRAADEHADQGAASAAGAAAGWEAAWHGIAVPRGAAYLLLLLQAVASAAAVLLAPRARPPSIAEQDWQHLVALLAASAMVLSLAGAWRRYQAAAAAGWGSAGAAPGAARRQRQQQREQQQQQQQQQQAAPPQDLSGVWIKDKAASDSMDEACDVMRLGGLVRLAIGLVKGVEIRMDGREFTFSLLSGILWFKVTERYAMDGRPARFKRRDLRRGQHTGRVQRCAATGGIVLAVEWGEPLGGSGTNRFYLAGPGLLHIETDMVVGGRPMKYTERYRRQGGAGEGAGEGAAAAAAANAAA